MQIARLKISKGDTWEVKKISYAREVRGLVESVTMVISNWLSRDWHTSCHVKLMIAGKTYKMDCATLPRIDVEEEIILHIREGKVIAFQIIKNNSVIFQCTLPVDYLCEYTFVERTDNK